MLTLTCCQDHILTENIWFVCSEASYSGDERRCHRCGTNTRTTEDRATQPMEAGGRVSQKPVLLQMVVHMPCPGEPAPSLLSPLLRCLPVTAGTTPNPVFLVSAKLVFIMFSLCSSFIHCFPNMTTFRDVLPNVHLVTATPRDEGVLRPMLEKAKVKIVLCPETHLSLCSLHSIWTYTSCSKAT